MWWLWFGWVATHPNHSHHIKIYAPRSGASIKSACYQITITGYITNLAQRRRDRHGIEPAASDTNYYNRFTNKYNKQAVLLYK
jgi:hypothetical protein